MPKYKPGDIIKLSENLQIDEAYDGYIWTPAMAKIAAEHEYICTITETEIPFVRCGRGRYHVDIFNFETVTDNMIESCIPSPNVDEILNFIGV